MNEEFPAFKFFNKLEQKFELKTGELHKSRLKYLGDVFSLALSQGAQELRAANGLRGAFADQPKFDLYDENSIIGDEYLFTSLMEMYDERINKIEKNSENEPQINHIKESQQSILQIYCSLHDLQDKAMEGPTSLEDLCM